MTLWIGSVWCLLLVVSTGIWGFTKAEEITEILTPSSPPKHLMSKNFPKTAPPNTKQTWNYKFLEEPGVEQGIRVLCRLSLPRDPVRRECMDQMILKDGRYSFPICGSAPFGYTSFTNDITITLNTGPISASKVECAVQLRTVKRPDYLKIESEEVDSSEFGGEEGEKSTSCPCGWANKVKSRIVNGTVTAPNEFPFLATLIRLPGIMMCGATIITRYHALTAAHCTDRRLPKDLGIVVGAHDRLKGKAFLIRVEDIIEHPDYDKYTKKNDIALLTLAKEIEFNQFIGPACLPQATPQLNLERQYVTIIGMGSEFFGAKNVSRFVKKVQSRVITMEECHEMFSVVDVTDPTQFCDFAQAKSSCQGDSGGPVVWVDPETNRYTVVGVTSFGKTCADYHPSVETRVQSYVDWIKTEVAKSGKPKSETCSKIN